ncbi:MAG: alpha-hydroxy acid oxidase, partial [Caulobacterales bacterium]
MRGRVAKAINIADLRALAQRRLPKMVFDYIDGAAEDETTLGQSTARLQAYRLVWDALVDVREVDLSTRVMGHDLPVPFIVSPTATQRLFHHDGERAMARAAQTFGTVYSLSTIGSTSIEDIAKATSGPKWFQVYVWKDRGLVTEILQRAKDAGFTGLILTVDVPVAGNRERDPRNDFTVPPKLNYKTVRNVLAKPEYLWNLMTHPKITAANFKGSATDIGIIEFINSQFDRGVTWKDAAWMRDTWGGAFAVKGVTHGEDAKRCADIDAHVWVSNHGGRQLDTSPATIDCLEEIVQAVAGKVDVIFDG